MKIHLVFAPTLLQSNLETLAESMWPPLGIQYLASRVRSQFPEIEIKLTDGCRLGFEATLSEIKAYDADIVGISFYTTMAFGAFQLSRLVREFHPRAWIVMGGPHANALPEETLRESGADLVVVGEGEEVFADIVKCRKENRPITDLHALTGIACLESSGGEPRFRRNKPRDFVGSLDKLPFPATDLVNFRDYRGWFLSKNWPEATIFSARGCPYHCTFCSIAVWKDAGPALRLRSAKNVVDEIEHLHRQGVREFFDQADEFNNSLKNALEICAELKKRNLGMTWKCQIRVKPFNEDLARAMAEAGCWYVHLGIETGNQETIDGIEKKIKLSDVEGTCRLLKKYGIKVLGLFMLYNVWEENGQLRFEDSEKSLRTLEFARGLFNQGLIDYMSWSITAPYPGSKLYDISVRHKLIDPRLLNNWEAWQKEDLFMLNLPGIPRAEQIRVKRKGELLRMRCMLRDPQFKLKDIPFLVKRAIHVLWASRSRKAA